LSSSGTTGLPKGAMLTHTNFVAIAAAFAAAGEFTADDILPGQLPFFHIFGLCTTLTACLSQGVTSVILPRFELGQLLQLVQDYGATRLYAVPPVLVALAKQPAVDRYDLSTVKTIICGAAPLGEEVARAVSRRLGCRVKQIYGLTEIAPTHLAPDDVHPSKLGSIGPCLPNTQCKVVDLVTGADLGPDQTGELWTRGPQAMKGYLNQPAATSQAIDGDGWVHTGDIGFADADGYFYVVDRLKELIKYKAHQVAPAELEAVLLAHAAVADAAVIPSPDDEAGEVPKAFVVLNGDATPEELLAFVAARVAPYKKIRRLEFVEAIPKSPSGKILRRVLVERERGSRADQAVGDAGSPGVGTNGSAPMTEDQETPARAHP
ncbi:MAG TPA: AMP-binding protein, partial [Thermomicrobiales bacterium]|nr:AMP-binding protein [Thermomicrobiales bacterium]